MKCPKCGNEVSREESFCGQCGTATMLPGQPAGRVNTPDPRTGGLSHSHNPPASPYNTQAAPPSSPYHAGMMPPSSNTYPPGTPAPSLPPQPPAAGQSQFPPGQSGPRQPSGFYQDATEAITVLPNHGSQNYPQQNFPGAGYPGGGTHGAPVQPFQSGNYPGSGYPPTQTFPSAPGYGYGTQPQAAPPPRGRSNTLLVIAFVLLVLAFLMAAGIGTLYVIRSQPPQAATPTPQPVQTATSALSPTATPTPAATPTPIPTPSPTLLPSPTPDPGFTFCDQSCTTNGYSVEYPGTWQQGTTSDSVGVEFANPKAPDEYAAFKVTAASGDKASDLVNTDLQSNFASKQDYVAPAGLQTTTIGGVTWVESIATYTLNGQTERIEVYATVRQGKNYLIELQAPDNQFDNVNSKYFVTMLGNFQFE